MLAEKLKTDTLANHQQLEKMLVSRMKSIRTKDEYIELLQLFYSYFGGLEEKIDHYITDSHLSDYGQRRKSAALAADIQALGGVPAGKASGADLPEIASPTQAFAAMYVIEGSTLGGQIISQMMGRQLGLQDDAGLSFFKGYGEDTNHMWAAFKQALNSHASTKAEQDNVIDTANQTFTKFKNWAEKHG